MIPPVVDVAWVRERSHEPAGRGDLVLADVRWYLDGRSGRAAYEAGHLPGAVYVELEGTLSTPGSPEDGRHPLPDPGVFAAGLAEAGIGDGDTVVAYDDFGGLVAARLAWLLRVTGQDAAILDGGLAAWGGPLERGPGRRPPSRFTPRPWPAERFADADDVLRSAGGAGSGVVLDVRDRERYRGERDPVDPVLGHVPGARSLPGRENLDATGRLLPVDELRRRFAAVGVDGRTPVIAYCGSGVNACQVLLVQELAGLGAGRLYPGSWSQYCHRPGVPVATGDQP